MIAALTILKAHSTAQIQRFETVEAIMVLAAPSEFDRARSIGMEYMGNFYTYSPKLKTVDDAIALAESKNFVPILKDGTLVLIDKHAPQVQRLNDRTVIVKYLRESPTAELSYQSAPAEVKEAITRFASSFIAPELLENAENAIFSTKPSAAYTVHLPGGQTISGESNVKMPDDEFRRVSSSVTQPKQPPAPSSKPLPDQFHVDFHQVSRLSSTNGADASVNAWEIAGAAYTEYLRTLRQAFNLELQQAFLALSKGHEETFGQWVRPGQQSYKDAPDSMRNVINFNARMGNLHGFADEVALSTALDKATFEAAPAISFGFGYIGRDGQPIIMNMLIQ